jgi:hypothetical protein
MAQGRLAAWGAAWTGPARLDLGEVLGQDAPVLGQLQEELPLDLAQVVLRGRKQVQALRLDRLLARAAGSDSLLEQPAQTAQTLAGAVWGAPSGCSASCACLCHAAPRLLVRGARSDPAGAVCWGAEGLQRFLRLGVVQRPAVPLHMTVESPETYQGT